MRLEWHRRWNHIFRRKIGSSTQGSCCGWALTPNGRLALLGAAFSLRSTQDLPQQEGKKKRPSSDGLFFLRLQDKITTRGKTAKINVLLY